MHFGKRLSLMASIALTFISPVFAQESTGTAARGHRSARGPMPLTNALNTMNLSEEQKQKIQEVREWANKRQDEIRKATGHTTETAAKLSTEEQRKLGAKVRPQMDALNKEIREKVDAILTADQRKELGQKLRRQAFTGSPVAPGKTDKSTTKAQ